MVVTVVFVDALPPPPPGMAVEEGEHQWNSVDMRNVVRQHAWGECQGNVQSPISDYHRHYQGGDRIESLIELGWGGVGGGGGFESTMCMLKAS